jgi:hypothetical protein
MTSILTHEMVAKIREAVGAAVIEALIGEGSSFLIQTIEVDENIIKDSKQKLLSIALGVEVGTPYFRFEKAGEKKIGVIDWDECVIYTIPDKEPEFPPYAYFLPPPEQRPSRYFEDRLWWFNHYWRPGQRG